MCGAVKRRYSMSKEQLMGRLLTATPSELERIEAVFNGKANVQPETGDRRLLTLMDAARELNVSRMTIHRMAADGRLPTVTTRAGRRRIASHAITEFLKGGE